MPTRSGTLTLSVYSYSEYIVTLDDEFLMRDTIFQSVETIDIIILKTSKTMLIRQILAKA